MLRDVPALEPQSDLEIFMNIPGIEEQATQESRQYIDPFEDVFGSAPPSPALDAHSPTPNDRTDRPNVDQPRLGPQDGPSDVPRLRSTHVTNGYREGIAASKDQHIQEGFDEGYGLGAEIALKAGWLIGALEGVHRALPHQGSSPALAAQVGSSNNVAETREEMRKMLESAEEELKVEKLFARHYFGEDGIWIFDVPGQENEGEITFAKVAEAHPLIQSWSLAVETLARQLGLALE